MSSVSASARPRLNTFEGCVAMLPVIVLMVLVLGTIYAGIATPPRRPLSAAPELSCWRRRRLTIGRAAARAIPGTGQAACIPGVSFRRSGSPRQPAHLWSTLSSIVLRVESFVDFPF